jgi:hypothetical protein
MIARDNGFRYRNSSRRNGCGASAIRIGPLSATGVSWNAPRRQALAAFNLSSGGDELPGGCRDSRNATGYIPFADGPAPKQRRKPKEPTKGSAMLYLRTASGTFINAATILQLTPQRAGQGDEITGWVAICEGGKAVTLAPYYTVPGRIDTVRASLAASAGANRTLASEAAFICPAGQCACLT